MSEIKQIKEEIINFILACEEYPTSRVLSCKYPSTDNNIKAFYKLLIKDIIAYDPENDSWMVIKKGD